MTTLSKALLTVAVGGLAGGSVIDYCDIKASPALAAVLPLGAIAFGLFLIVFMLEGEVAKYDQEQEAKLQLFQPNAAPAPAPSKPFAHAPVIQLKEKSL